MPHLDTYRVRTHTFCCFENTLGTDALDVALAATAGRADATTTTAIVDSVLQDGNEKQINQNAAVHRNNQC